MSSPDPEKVLSELRRLSASSLSQNMLGSAAFFCNKALSLSADPRDAVALAQIQLFQGHGLRAVAVLERQGLLEASETPWNPLHLQAMHLAATALFQAERSDAVVEMLERILPNEKDLDAIRSLSKAGRESNDIKLTKVENEESTTPSGIDIVASLCATMGLAFEVLENRTRATEYLVAALEIDPRCVEAMETLLNSGLLPVVRLKALIVDLRARLAPELGWLGDYYALRSAVLDPATVESFSTPELVDQEGAFGNNVDIIAAKAEAAYYADDVAVARTLAQKVHSQDPHHERCALVLFASLLEQENKNDLYYLAHKMIEQNPSSAVSWVGVGCYYLATKRPDLAQRYFHKATKLQPRLAQAWIGFGNAFSAQDESDQAMAAYRSAARLLPGSHVPSLYIGMEYLRSSNLSLAASFLSGAMGLNPLDPLIYNEIGVVAYRKGQYAEAEGSFRKALSLARPEALIKRWAPTLVNLGHSLRKQRRFSEALKNYQAALALEPNAADVLAASAFTHHLAGDVSKAISMYHKSLSICPEDAFASEMLEKALQVTISLPLQEANSMPNVETSGDQFMNESMMQSDMDFSPFDTGRFVRRRKAPRFSVGSHINMSGAVAGETPSGFDLMANTPSPYPQSRMDESMAFSDDGAT